MPTVITRKGTRMKKIIVFALAAFILTEAASAAGSDTSSSSATTSSSDRYGNSDKKNKNVDIFSEVNSLISRSKFEEAHAKLAVMKAGANEADRLNLLGFTARKTGNLSKAGKYYDAALELHPKHTGALEYQGELFIQLGMIDRAKLNLAKLEKICWLPCSAERQLREAINSAMTN